MTHLLKTLALCAGLVTAAAHAQAANINVLTGWYGQSCGTAHGNVSSHIKWRCDGRTTCSYFVDANIVGDPAPNCPKNMVVMYACEGQGTLRLAQLPPEASGRSIQLNCLTPEPVAR